MKGILPYGNNETQLNGGLQEWGMIFGVQFGKCLHKQPLELIGAVDTVATCSSLASSFPEYRTHTSTKLASEATSMHVDV